MSGRFEEIRGSAEDLGSWHALVTGTQPPFQRVKMASGAAQFSGRLSCQVLDRISAHLVEIKASHHVIRQTEEYTRTTPEALYVIMFQLDGASHFTQAGARAVLRPGDYTVSTSTVPFEWEFIGDFSVFMLGFPQAFIDAPPQSLLPLTGQALSPDDGFGKHMVPFIESIARDPDVLRGPVGRRVAQNLVDLFTTSFLAHLERRSGSAELPSASMFQRLVDYIGRHLSDPELDSQQVAAANFISTRYLQSIFNKHGTTVSSWIRERRLGGVRRDLSDPVLADRSIGELATKWGFLDHAYFSRLFRQAFGESPNQWRRRALHYPQAAPPPHAVLHIAISCLTE
jgi:AraC-like DNA-binding protein